jgi:hypothetical protein
MVQQLHRSQHVQSTNSPDTNRRRRLIHARHATRNARALDIMRPTDAFAAGRPGDRHAPTMWSKPLWMLAATLASLFTLLSTGRVMW